MWIHGKNRVAKSGKPTQNRFLFLSLQSDASGLATENIILNNTLHLMPEESFRPRSKSRTIKVTFPSGKVLCCKSATDTLVGALKEIESALYAEIGLQVCHLPLVSKERYPRFKDYMRELKDGWWVNTLSNTDQKYMQLRSISDSLSLGFKVEIGYGLEVVSEGTKAKGGKTKEKMTVRFPDGTTVGGQSPLEMFCRTIVMLGVDSVMRRQITWGSGPLLSRQQVSRRQVEIAPERWLTVPSSTKDKVKLLKVVGSHMRVALDVTIPREIPASLFDGEDITV